jgi:hypothetical protein
MKLVELSDVQLLEGLKSLVGQGRAVLARLLAHLVEVEERRLHLARRAASRAWASVLPKCDARSPP